MRRTATILPLIAVLAWSGSALAQEYYHGPPAGEVHYDGYPGGGECHHGCPTGGKCHHGCRTGGHCDLASYRDKAHFYWKWFWRQYCLDYSMVKQWPAQHVPADRAAARAPFHMMVAKGWARQNTLSEYHFKDGSAQLSSVGRAKIRTILTFTPDAFRSISYVGGPSAEVAAARGEAIEREVATYLPEGDDVPVARTILDIDSYPADRYEMIDLKFRQSTPAPRLPSASSSGGEEGGF